MSHARTGLPIGQSLFEGATGMGALGEGDGVPGQALHLVGGDQFQGLPETIVGIKRASQFPGADPDLSIGRLCLLSERFETNMASPGKWRGRGACKADDTYQTHQIPTDGDPTGKSGKLDEPSGLRMGWASS